MPRTLDLAECADCRCFRARRLARALSVHYDALLRPTGLRGTQFSVLAVLAGRGPTPLAALADALGLDRTSLTRNLGPLQRRRLVSSSGTPDGRVRLLEVTKRGIAALTKSLPAWREAQATADAVTRRIDSPATV